MTDEPLFDEDHTFADDPSRWVVYVRREDSYPGGVYYRMQYYDTETEATILRYDNAHDAADIGHHHRHYGDEHEGIDFTAIETHLERFFAEVYEIHAERTRSHTRDE